MRVSDNLPTVIEVSYMPPGEEADLYEYRLARWIMSFRQEEKEEGTA